MTTKGKIILGVVITGVVGTAFWLWYRQKDAVPASAIPTMQQARMVIGSAAAPTSLVQSEFPTDIPLPTPISTT